MNTLNRTERKEVKRKMAKVCSICGKPIGDWAEICPECAPIRIEEAVAVVCTSKGMRCFADKSEARKCFEQTKEHARLVVQDPKESWKCIAVKSEE